MKMTKGNKLKESHGDSSEFHFKMSNSSCFRCTLNENFWKEWSQNLRRNTVMLTNSGPTRSRSRTNPSRTRTKTSTFKVRVLVWSQRCGYDFLSLSDPEKCREQLHSDLHLEFIDLTAHWTLFATITLVSKYFTNWWQHFNLLSFIPSFVFLISVPPRSFCAWISWRYCVIVTSALFGVTPWITGR